MQSWCGEEARDEVERAIAFSQLDETIAGGVPAMFLTEQVELKIGTHKENI